MSRTLVSLLVGLVMLVGLAGVVVPVLPGLALIWAAALGYGLLVGWGSSGLWLFGIISLLALAGLGAELWVTGAGARSAGASLWGILAGLGLGLAGLVFFSLPGAIVGLIAGTIGVEYLRQKDWRKAMNAALGTAVGCGASFGVKLLLGTGMIAAWVAWVLLA
ncbi:MAG: DUF456 domain-containing protein [Chloroflexota bacterium]